MLLRHVLDIDRTRLFLRYPESLGEEDSARFETLVSQRLAGAPVAYLTGTREFMGLPFHVAPGVLIPRPDTEPLVEWALEWLRDRRDARVVDIGTGSGAIAIAVAAHLGDAFRGEIIATDQSADALRIAEHNADALLDDARRGRIRFVEGSLTEPLDEPVDLLLTNLPYLTPGQIAENPDLEAEPRVALDGGEDGLDLVRAVVDALPDVLSPGGACGFEIDPSQADAVATILTSALPGSRVSIVKDLAQRSRHVVATTESSTNT